MFNAKRPEGYELIKSDKQLLAICENIVKYRDKPLEDWDKSDLVVRKLANDKAQSLGYKDWYDAYLKLKE